MIPVGRVLNIEGLALELGCKVGRIPSSYLGMPLGAAFNSLAVWDGVEERFRRRLAMWKRQYISKGGRLTLIRSTMSSMPIYLMSLFHLPRKVRFANERDALWRSVISLKYGVEEGGWCTRDVMGRNGVGLWKAIRKKWGLFDGRNAWVSEVWNPVGDGIGWTPLFARAFNDWEIDLVERLLAEDPSFQGQREEEDRVIWTASNNGAFSIRSLYSMMEPGGLSLFPSERIWRARVPPRCFLCLSEEETVDHLLLHCVKTRVLWNLLFSLFGISWTLSVYSEDNPSWVEWRVCGKKTQEGLANGAFMGSLAESHSSLVSFVDWIGS
ncbi:hypothetical protein CK203_035974 [Vitis vinifera]|uniref:Reverse transcriptase zinc-binding domain-containing protein n=1 Tax=Vitis vinifera TaxID=29760 RepID=A0A438I090_VITVI|nr:hypothetical protein CK203_035974 [Vitis vinifera]